MQEARYYRQAGEEIVCELCPQNCRLKEGQEGICGVRLVKGRKLFSRNYYLCGALAMDPIEKKPLYHFYPGWEILSVGTLGCNLHCVFCQNWNLARGEKNQVTEVISPEKLFNILKVQPTREQLGVAYTYNEPTVWYEFVLDSSRFLAEKGYKNVLVTNGFINEKPLEELLPFIHAMNIDVKSFNDAFYRRYCKGKGIKDILRTVERAHTSCHVELTYLIITTLNDKMEEIKEFVNWVVSLDKEIPVHFSRYFPSYRLDLPPTPMETMRKAWEMAKEKLPYVYLGNVLDVERSSTYCPSCNALLIRRRGYKIENLGIRDKSCTSCGYTIRLAGHIYGDESGKTAGLN